MTTAASTPAIPPSTPPVREPAHAIDPLFIERWSPRAFTDATLDDATLLGFFEAARWAPSSFNAQPWRFLYGKRGSAAWQPIADALLPFNRAWAERAAVLVAVVSRTRWVPPGKTESQAIGSHAFDAGAAWAQLALQVTRAGWHAHAMGGFDPAKLREGLGVPEDHALHAVVAIGQRGEASLLPEALQARELPSQRLPLASLVAEGRFAFEAG